MRNVLGKFTGILFGLIFAGFGFFFLFMTSVPLLQSWLATRDWQPGYAEIVTVQAFNNDTQARYRYTYQDINHQGHRVYLAEFKDNIGSYHKKLQVRLSAHKKSGQPIQIWVDPRNPQNSIIDREMRWGLFTFMTLFCSVFICIGLFISWSALTTKPRQQKKTTSFSQLKTAWQEYKKSTTRQLSFLEFVSRQRSKAQQQDDQSHSEVVDKVWLNKKGWLADGIRSEAKTSAIGMWFFAVFWNAVSSPIFFVFTKEWQSGNYAILLALLFPLVGFYLLFKATSITREYFRFGTILCKLDPFPGAIGGNVGGTLDISNITINNPEFRIELECIYSYVAGSGKNRSRRENVLWAEAGSAKINRLAKGFRIQFCFDVPEDLPQSDWQQRGEYHFWRLHLRSSLPGVDLDRTYNIPVYKTGKQSSKIYPNLSQQMLEEQETHADSVKMALERGDFNGAGLKGALKIRKIDRGILLVHPLFRNKLLTLFALFFGGAFSAATIAILTNFGSSGFFKIFSIVFSLPFGLVGIVGLCAAIYLPLNNLRVTVAKGNITVLRRLLFIPLVFRQLTSSEITSCSIQRSGSSGQGANKKEYFKIIAHTTSGKKYTVSEGICSKNVAEQFREYLYRRMKAGY